MNQLDTFMEEIEKKSNINTSSTKSSINPINCTEKCKGSNSNSNIKSIDNNHSTYSTVVIRSTPRNSVMSNSGDSSNSGGSISTQSTIFQRSLTPVSINNLNDQLSNDDEFENYIRHDIVQDTVDTSTTQCNNQGDQGLRTRSSSRSIISKRRSLIQPIIVQNDYMHKKNVSSSSMDINQSFHKNIGKTITNENSTLSSIDSNFDTNYIEKSNTFISLVDTNNVNDLLKNLANKELQLLESKRNIEELKRKLLYYEKLYDQQYSDLKKLKAEVSRHISDKSMMNVNISNDSTKKESQAGDEIIQSTPEKHFQVIKKQSSDVNINKVEPSTSPLMIRKRNNIDINFQRDTTRRNLSDMSKESHIAVTEFNPIDYNPPKKPQSKYESMWSKPFAFFNQFDQLLQSELEKSLNWDNETENDSSFIEETDKEEPNEVVRSEITAKNTGHKPNSNDCLCNKSVNDKRHPQPSNQSLTRSVSTSLWGFVNDMREGLLGTYDIVDDHKSSSQDTTGMEEFNTTRKNDHINRSVEMSYI